jgi:Protein of unknown function (DUF433)
VSQSVVKIDPEIMSGAPCFAGTRVPIQNLIDYLEGGDSIEDFLEKEVIPIYYKEGLIEIVNVQPRNGKAKTLPSKTGARATFKV